MVGSSKEAFVAMACQLLKPRYVIITHRCLSLSTMLIKSKPGILLSTLPSNDY